MKGKVLVGLWELYVKWYPIFLLFLFFIIGSVAGIISMKFFCYRRDLFNGLVLFVGSSLFLFFVVICLITLVLKEIKEIKKLKGGGVL